MESLKMTHWHPESINRRTDKTIANRKRTKRQTIIYKTLHIKLTKETPQKAELYTGVAEG